MADPSAPAEDDDNFELVDYTAASAWEKFVAAIETLLGKWRVSDGRLGDFNFGELRSTCDGLVVRRRQDRSEVGARIARLCTRVGHLSYKGTTYALTLSVHPLLQGGADVAAFDSQFPPEHVPELEVNHSQMDAEPAWHPLHRWTGRAALLYLQYVGDTNHWDSSTPDSSESIAGPGDNYSVSLETAKHLMSSMNIALHNARCVIPAFVPVGDAWRCLFTGRAVGSSRAQPPVIGQKFESACLTPAPSAYLQLGGLLELFAETFRLDAHMDPPAADVVQLAALHTYRIKNTYSRDWNTASPDFYCRVGDLNVGPTNDPLRFLSLDALFQRAPCRTYIDPQQPGRDRLYLKTASTWLLSARMFPAERERTMLTEVLEDAFASWAQSAGDSNRHRHLSLAEQIEAHAEITSDMLVDLFGAPAGSQVSVPGLDPAAQDTAAAKAVEARLDQALAEVYADDSAAQDRPPSVPQLTARMSHGTAVPHGSLMWRLSEIILVATAKRSADYWGAPSIMTFLRLLWAMALKEIRWRWENGQLLPRIPTAAEHAAEMEDARSGSQTPAVAPSPMASAQPQTHFNVHLRHALVHQKLEMLNCCTERRLARSGLPVQPAATAPGPMASASATSAPCPLDAAGAGSGLAQRMRAHVVGQLRRRGSAGGEPGARSRIRRPIGRLLRTMRAGGGTPSADCPAADIGEFEDIGAYASDSEGFVSAEDDYMSDGAAEGHDVDDDGSSGALLLLDQASQDESSSTPMRLPANAGAGTRDSNYINVAVASSLDSASGFHHISDVYERGPSASTASSTEAPSAPSAMRPEAGGRGGSSCIATGPPDVEELGDDERAGGLHESATMRLLETGQPMWIPKIQMQAVLTEDMLGEREAILMSFGTSAEGTRQRARVQCAELISDMESFKAANPRCSLADFVRWHSPRDWVVPEGADEMDGALSVRMAAGSAGNGNLWHQLWAEARRVPADRQRLLFDDTIEAEKALHYLEGMPVHALFASLLPTMLLIAYERLYRQPVVHRIPMLRSQLAALGTRIAQRMDWAAVGPDSTVFGSLLDDLERLEVQTSRCVSLLSKFPAQYALVEAVVQRGRAAVGTRDAQKVVLRALSRFSILAAAPACREYTFTADLDGAPQRMHVAIEDDRSIRVMYGQSQTRPHYF
ncbi:hypothetical protein H4R19_001450 [Coemansia spiralis]|nr:hypothetical protein H4R19_001450 [Coemansia spiralis]